MMVALIVLWPIAAAATAVFVGRVIKLRNSR